MNFIGKISVHQILLCFWNYIWISQSHVIHCMKASICKYDEKIRETKELYLEINFWIFCFYIYSSNYSIWRGKDLFFIAKLIHHLSIYLRNFLKLLYYSKIFSNQIPMHLYLYISVWSLSFERRFNAPSKRNIFRFLTNRNSLWLKYYILYIYTYLISRFFFLFYVL